MTALNPLHSIGRQLDEVFRIHTALGAAARREKVLARMADVHLPDPPRIAHSFPHQLSGGQRQRTMIAMALALDPKLLIADEPTTALDVTTQAQILHLIRELQRSHGAAVLFITHDFGVVADIADQVAVLQRGVLVQTGRRDAVLDAPRHAYTKALLDAVPKLAPPHRSPFVPGPVVLESIEARKAYRQRGLFRRGRATVALDGVDMALRRGETLGLVGESGSGKSTLARALALEPKVLVADEPVSALDVSVQAQVLNLLADIKAELRLSLLFVTHDLRVALQICDRIAVMRHGAIVELAPTAEIFARPRHPYTKALFDAVPGAAWSQGLAAAAQ